MNNKHTTLSNADPEFFQILEMRYIFDFLDHVVSDIENPQLALRDNADTALALVVRP